MKILIIDDEEVISTCLKQIVEMLGHDAHECNNPLEANDFVVNGSFDLIITDLRMPGMTGGEIIASIRMMKNILQKIPKVIAMSGGGIDVDPVIYELKKIGIEFIEKPFSISKISELLAKYN